MHAQNGAICVVIGNGLKPPQKSLCRLVTDAATVIAADGGANHCFELGITPHYIVGDLDSIRPDVVKAFEHLSQFESHPTCKDKMDLQLALERAEALNSKEIHVFSWISDEFDYALCNFWICTHLQTPATLWDHKRTGYVLNKKHSDLKLQDLIPGQRVSIFPGSDHASLKSKGLRWEINWDGITAPVTSQSNEVAQAQVFFQLSSGTACVFITQENQ